MADKKELNKLRIVIGIVFLYTLIFQLTDNAFTLITPALMDTYRLSTGVASWVASIGGIGVAVGFLVFSSFTDFFNEKKLLIIGVLLSCFPSVIALLFQGNYYVIVASRFVQTFGEAAASALSLVLVAKYLPAKEQVIWLGFSSTSFSLATVLGTSVGGFLSSHAGWQFIFYVPLISILGLPFIYRYLPNHSDKKSNLDYKGFILLAALFVCFNFFFSSPNIYLFIGILVFILLFVINTKKAANPFVPPHFFKNKRFICILAAIIFYYLAQTALVFLTPFLLEDLLGYSLNQSSLVFIIPYAIAGLLAVVSGIIINKTGIRRTMFISAAIIMFGLLLAGFGAAGGISYVTVALTLITVGYAFSYSPLFTGAISTLSQNEMGTGIGLFNFIMNASNALGISLSGILLNSSVIRTNIFAVKDSLAVYANTFLFFAITALVGTVIYYTATSRLKSAEQQ